MFFIGFFVQEAERKVVSPPFETQLYSKEEKAISFKVHFGYFNVRQNYESALNILNP